MPGGQLACAIIAIGIYLARRKTVATESETQPEVVADTSAAFRRKPSDAGPGVGADPQR